MRKILILIAVVLSLTIPNVLAIENNVYNCPMGGAAYGLNGSYGISSMILGWILSILLVILLLAGIYWFVKSANKNNGGENESKSYN